MMYKFTNRAERAIELAGEIAAELGLSIRAVEGRLYRLRKKLRKELEHEYE